MQHPSVTSVTLNAFVDYATQFLDSLREVFPECASLREVKLAFDVSVLTDGEENKVNLIMAWHEHMEDYYEMCVKRDDRVFLEVNPPSFLESVDFKTKWRNQSTDDIKTCIWEYMDVLNKYAQMYMLYSNVPNTIMDKIQTMAVSMASKIHTGEMSFTDLNLSTVGEQVAQNMEQGEIEQFANNMMGNRGMMASLSNMMGSLPSMMQAAPRKLTKEDQKK